MFFVLLNLNIYIIKGRGLQTLVAFDNHDHAILDIQEIWTHYVQGQGLDFTHYVQGQGLDFML